MKKVVVLGAGKSGMGAAILAKHKGYQVYVSDNKTIDIRSKEELERHDIFYQEGKHTYEKLKDADIVVKSPGIPNTTPIIKELKKDNKLIMSEIEFAYKHSKGNVIAVTGSNGKTTTSTLIYDILSSETKDLVLAGNIGNSYAREVAKKDALLYVLEISSFQLDNIHTFAPKVAVITNITKDHLERYKNDFKKYTLAKFAITKYQKEGDYLIYNADDEVIVETLKHYKTKATLVPLSLHKKLNYGVYIHENNIHINMKRKHSIPLSLLSIKGKHNHKNAMVATAVGEVYKIKNDNIRASFQAFRGINHRLENVRKIGSIKFINDSKATNINSVYYALESITTQVIWIAGGEDKGNDYMELMPLVREKVKAIVCLGIDNEKIINTFKNTVSYIAEVTSMKEAVRLSDSLATHTDTVLLSPACASFDLFKDYEDRGNQFKKYVNQLPEY